MNRRKFLKTGAIGTCLTVHNSLANSGTAPTPTEIEGPFYPVIAQKDKDFDLTTIKGHKTKALGKPIFIAGQVFDTEGRPVENATVDLWQANAAGKYHHPHDTNQAAIDDNFQGWAIISTDQEGHFQFKTVLPGAYPVAKEWTRPPHIHFKISKKGYIELITQMYFPEHKLNKLDRLLQRKTKEEQKLMTAEQSKGNPDMYYYKITIEKV